MNRRGMTLVEMMVATTMSLIILGIIAQLFGMLGKGISGSRSALSLSEQLRAVGNTLRTDLSGLTVQTLPPVSADSDCGYLEIIEGNATATLAPGSSDDPGAATRATTLTGDCDDILLLTTRSFDSPFVGRFESGQIESQYAEVAWFCRPSPAAFQAVAGSTLYTLYRRQLLVMGYVGAGQFLNTNSIAGTIPACYGDYDLSVHDNGSNQLFPNSLSDLTRRENRFLHNPSGVVSNTNYPYANFTSPAPATAVLSGSRTGEDIVLTNVLAFDVKVFDPDAPVQNLGAVAVGPGDPGYSNATAATGRGAYVDIGFNGGSPVGMAATFPPANSTPLMSAGVRVTGTGGALANKVLGRVYDTGSLHYEFNGINEDGDFVDSNSNSIQDPGEPDLIDEGTNGQDDNGDGVIDDEAERETSPPYPVPLRGLEVRIRCYEPQSRQVRQVTVRHTFVPH